MNKAEEIETRNISLELQKCKDNPYYFATKYIFIAEQGGKKVPFTTPYSEEEFNKIYKQITE